MTSKQSEPSAQEVHAELARRWVASEPSAQEVAARADAFVRERAKGADPYERLARAEEHIEALLDQIPTIIERAEAAEREVGIAMRIVREVQDELRHRNRAEGKAWATVREKEAEAAALRERVAQVEAWVQAILNDPGRTNDEPYVEAARGVAAVLQEGGAE